MFEFNVCYKKVDVLSTCFVISRLFKTYAILSIRAMCDIVLIVIGLIVGLPTIIIGCNDFSCPLHEKVMANSSRSTYLSISCTDAICGDHRCVDINYDCSHWETTVIHYRGNCVIDSGPYNIGTDIEIYINKMDNICRTGFEKTIRILPFVGIVFLSISAITILIVIIAWIVIFSLNYDTA
jgi:protein-S-isoprenylcysteine O-methyltransferase Ste14